MRTNPGQRLKPQPAQPVAPAPRSSAEAAHVHSACSRGPASVSSGDRVELHGVRQRHRYRRGRPGHRQPSGLIRHKSSDTSARRAQPAQIVEPDHRIRPGQLHLGVQIPQQPISQTIGQRAQLLLGVLDQRPQRRLPGDHLPPVQPPHAQRHRIQRGEPAHRARQIHPGGQLLVAAVALHIDTDRPPPVPTNSAHANPNAINKMSCTPA